jgi:AraC-like DNA-binding protein
MIWSDYGKHSRPMEPHKHDMHEFFVCLNSNGVQHIEGQSCGFRPGRAFMLYSGCMHQLEPAGDGMEFIFVCFDKNHLAQSGYLHLQEQIETRQKRACYFSGTESGYLEFNIKTISTLHKETSSPGLLQNELINALLVQLLVAFFRSTDLEMSELNPVNEKRSKVMQLCRKAAIAPSLEMTLSQAARATGTCRSAFAALVKETTGLSWREYILDCRLKKAVEMLAASKRQIMEIALECGFNNMGYFHRTFFKKYGCTPGVMRKTLQANRFPHILKLYD